VVGNADVAAQNQRLHAPQGFAHGRYPHPVRLRA
jgi:hypothetical protein